MVVSADPASADVARVGAADGSSTLDGRPVGADGLAPVARRTSAADVDAPALALRVVGVVVGTRVRGRAARSPAVRSAINIDPYTHDVTGGAGDLAACCTCR